jgi:hypothetical protein
MPTPGERRALIFIASVAALGVAVRGWRELHPQDSAALAGNRAALARQIEAVDSAIAVSPAKKKARAPRPDAPRSESAPRVVKSRTRSKSPPDTTPRDPRQAYWDRIARSDSIARSGDHAQHESAIRRPPSQLPSTVRRLPSQPKWSTPPVDLDRASLDEIAAVIAIGPALARRIVMNRVDGGPFGSMTGLQRVPGITAAFAHRIEPFVTFSLAPRCCQADTSPSRRVRKKNSSTIGNMIPNPVDAIDSIGRSSQIAPNAARHAVAARCSISSDPGLRRSVAIAAYARNSPATSPIDPPASEKRSWFTTPPIHASILALSPTNRPTTVATIAIVFIVPSLN